jgi:hypothetical protein
LSITPTFPICPISVFFIAHILAATALNGKDFEFFACFSLIVVAEADSILANHFWANLKGWKNEDIKNYYLLLFAGLVLAAFVRVR